MRSVVFQHPLSGEVLDYLAYDSFWEHYDLRAGTECVVRLGVPVQPDHPQFGLGSCPPP